MLTFLRGFGIRVMGLKDRIVTSILLMLIVLDQSIAVTVAIPFYIVGLAPEPNPDETISSNVGRAAVAGNWWALILEWIIDRLAYCFNGGHMGHCREDIEYDEIPWDEAHEYR